LQYVSNILKLHRNDFDESSKTTSENLDQCINNLCNDIKCATVLVQRIHSNCVMNNSLDKKSLFPDTADFSLCQSFVNEIEFLLYEGN